MSTSVTWNGSSFSVPATGEEDWGGSTKVDGLLISLAQNALSKAGGTFALSAEVDFSGTAGLKAIYYKSRGTVATSGILRLANLELISWRNAADSGNKSLQVTASDLLAYDGDTVCTLTATQTLTNKTLTAPTITGAVIDVVDNSFSIKDESDATKILKFQVSGITTATTRTMTVPDADFTVVGLATTQTLTNKTLTTPTITGVSTIQTGLTSGAKFGEYSDTTKYIVFDQSLCDTGIRTAFSFANTATNKTYTFPNASMNVVGDTTTQALQAKDYQGGTASNTSRFTLPKDTLANITSLTRKQATLIYASDVNKVFKDDGTNLTEVGSGSSGINYITLPDAESGLGSSQWAAYADAAASTPADGTGGSPSSTLTASSDTSLRGTKNFLFTKGAANRQGEGFSFPFTIDGADQAKVLNISFDYIASSGMVVGSSADMAIWIYDVTNTVLIPVSPYQLQANGSLPYKFTGTFQTSSNSTSYRLIFHVATTSTTAYTLRVDNVVVGPQIQLYGAPISDWTSFTSVVTGTSSNPSKASSPAADSAMWRRVGDSMEVTWTYRQTSNTGAAAGSGSYLLAIPTGYTIDTAKITASATTFPAGTCGQFGINGTTVSPGAGRVNVYDSTRVYFNYSNATQAGTWGSGNQTFSDASVEVSTMFTVPIVGWSSTVLMSSDTDTRVVAARYNNTSASVFGTAGTISFGNKNFDTHNAFSTPTYTVPVSGKYRCTVSLAFASMAYTTNEYIQVNLRKNTSIQTSRTQRAQASTTHNWEFLWTDTIDVVAGDTLDFYLVPGTSNNPTLTGLAVENYCIFERLSGPSAIAATETVAAKYYSSGQTVGTSQADIVCSTKEYDTHGAVSSGIFTCPVSGTYRMGAKIQGGTAVSSSSTNQTVTVIAVKSGNPILDFVRFRYQVTGVNLTPEVSGTVSTKCVAGDTLKFQVIRDSNVSSFALTSDVDTTIFFERVGN